jgi:hypothetical protein
MSRQNCVKLNDRPANPLNRFLGHVGRWRRWRSSALPDFQRTSFQLLKLLLQSRSFGAAPSYEII